MAEGSKPKKSARPRRSVPPAVAAAAPVAVADLASAAKTLDAMRAAVAEAAGAGNNLWLSYLFALFYLLIAVGSVTHRDLLLETPIKLPFLGVELPLVGFFALGPLIFLVVHAYVLLHLVLLADKVGTFRDELKVQYPDDKLNDPLRRELPSNFLVQVLAGPSDVRAGIFGFLLRLIGYITLVAGPIALLLFFQLQFLPYHHDWLTWWHRLVGVADIALLWLLWPSIARGRATRVAWRDFCRVRVTASALASLAVLSFAFTIATYRGERLDALPPLSWVPTQWPSLKPKDKEKAQAGRLIALVQSMGWTTLHKLLIAADVDPVSNRPSSLWSDRLVLPYADVIDGKKFDSEAKIAAARETISLRGRNLEGAVLIGARLRKADLTAANLRGARLDAADLREAKFECAQSINAEDVFDETNCAILAGASLKEAQLQGALLSGARLQRASLTDVQLQGASLSRSQLQGAILYGAKLQRAALDGAQLENALLEKAQLQDAQLDEANLRGAQLKQTQMQRASLNLADMQGASLDEADLRGASLRRANLQGASLNRADLRGALLDKARLQGASVDFARLEGVSLGEAELEGASFNYTKMHGAWLNVAQLQGASLYRTDLRGAIFRFVYVWRADPTEIDNEPKPWVPLGKPVADPIYFGLNCQQNKACRWTTASYATLKRNIEQNVPGGSLREAALNRIKKLEPESLDSALDAANDKTIADAWRKLVQPAHTVAEHDSAVAKVLQDAGCAADGAPYVVHRLIEIIRRYERDLWVGNNNPSPAQLAAVFLDEKTCPGARGLSKEDKDTLREICGSSCQAGSGTSITQPHQ